MNTKILTALTGAALMASCASDPDVLGDYFNSLEGDVTTSTVEELATHGLAIDTTALAETETIDASDEDYIENNEFKRHIYIAYDGTSATVTGSYSGVSVTTNGADVVVTSSTKKVAYHVSGTTTDGNLKIYSDYKFALYLEGASIANGDGAAINIQSKKRGFLVVADGTTNTLADGTAYTDTIAGEDQKAALFTEGKLLVSGTGKLRITGNGKAALRSDKYILLRPGTNVLAQSAAANAVKTNDGIFIRGGVLNAVSTAANARALTSEGPIEISGGRTILIASGTNENGKSDGAALKADTTFTVSGGSLACQSTYSNAIHAKQTMTVTGGVILAYGAASSAYGICCDDGALTINGGSIAAIGGQTSTPSSASTQAFAALNTTGSVAAGKTLTLQTADGTSLIGLVAPRTYSGYALLLSTAGLSNGTPYLLSNGESTLATFSLSASATTFGN